MRSVALIIDTLGSYGRGLLGGVTRFLRTRGGWRVIYEERKGVDQLPRWLTKGICDGAIVRLRDGRQLAAVAKLGIPVVSLGEVEKRPRSVLEVLSDHRIIGELAASHLIERNVKHFGFFASAKAVFSELRFSGFREYLMARNYSVHLFGEDKWDFGTPKYKPRGDKFWEDARLDAWLSNLPKPIGIMACNDYFGRLLLAQCEKLGFHVPNEIAVVGVDNDELLCDLASPPMSSVDPGADAIGFRAAELLEDMLSGRSKPAPDETLYCPPRSVIARASTNVIAFDDQIVVKALQYIREKNGVSISADDVLDHLADHGMLVSKSTLERKFRQHVRASPHDEIAHARLSLIERLLIGTSYPLTRIANMTGMNEEQQLVAFFRRHRGTTPGSFRKQSRGARRY